MSRKVFITLLVAVLTAGLAAQSVADQYNFDFTSATLFSGRAGSLVVNGTTGFDVNGYGVVALDLNNLSAPFVSRAMSPGLSYNGVLVGNHLVTPMVMACLS